MEQTWFDLPVENRLTEVWPKGLLKRSKMVPNACKTAEMTFPMPYWNLPVVPMDQKIPLLPGPKDLYHLARSKLGEKLWGCEDSEFSLNEVIKKEIFNAYEILHDPNLAHYLKRPKVVKRLKELGLVDSQLGVMCNLKDYNYYRRYLAFVHNNAINKYYREMFNKGDSNLEVAALTEKLEKQNAKARIAEEIEQRHAEVFKEISAEKKKKAAVCERRLRRVEEVFEKRKSNNEAKRIAAREAAKDFTKKVKENLFYANAQLRQHKLDTMRKWRTQNIAKAALFECIKKKRQQEFINKKREWFQNKIKHQEKRVLQETQINVLMDHDFSPEYKRYLKYIKRENYKNPPAQTAGPEYRISSDSELEDNDLLNQLRLFTKTGYQLQRGSFISKAQAKKNVAKLASFRSTTVDQVRRMSDKYMEEIKGSKNKRHSVLDALINSSILRLLSPSLQDVFKKSQYRSKKKKAQKAEKAPEQVLYRKYTSIETAQEGEVEESKESTEESEVGEEDEDVIGFDRDSEIEIRPPNKTIPPPPICHLNVYRYFDRVLGKVILEYVTRILLPKFPEIINRCHWVSKAEGLPEDDVSKEEAPCHPEDCRDSYTECMQLMQESSDKKMASYLLLLSESPDIRLFRHKLNGIGEITCPESLVGNFLVQSSPHAQHILDYIYWRADWILNYPPPKTYQEIYDLKYVIGVMKNIECPVYQPIYKLWEITNDINLNPEVLEKFVLHMQKKKEQKPMVKLNPVDIAVKNVRKIIAPLTMNYKVIKELDDNYLDIFKAPSELFKMSYLKKPVDPKIWKILDDLLEKSKKNPEELECLRCEPEHFKKKFSLIENFADLDHNLAESLFIDPDDFTAEVKKAKEEEIEEVEEGCHVSFGLTEFIPYVEAQIFTYEEVEVAAGRGVQKEIKKRPSILRSKESSRDFSRTSKQRRRSSGSSQISNQKKETNLAAKLQNDDADNKSENLSPEKKNDGRDPGRAPEEDNKVENPETSELETNAGEMTDEEQIIASKADAPSEDFKKGGKTDSSKKGNKEITSKENKEDKKKVKGKKRKGKKLKGKKRKGKKRKGKKRKGKKGKGKKRKGKKRKGKKRKGKKRKGKKGKGKKGKGKKGKGKKGKGKKGKGKKDKGGKTDVKKTEEVWTDDKVSDEKEMVEVEDKAEVPDNNKNKLKLEIQLTKDVKSRVKSLSIMKTSEVALNIKGDLNVKFTSKKYVDPHIMKTLDVTESLKKSKDRPPTPHPSFMSLPEVPSTVRASVDTQKLEEIFNVIKHKPCTRDSDLEQPNYETRHEPEEEPHTEPVSEELIINVIQPEEPVEDKPSKGGDSCISMGSDLEYLRKFVSSKLPHKQVVVEKTPSVASGTEPRSVPPIINKSLLPRRRIIKRPLANILRKIYGWVMTTVIRRRFLLSFDLPPKIKKECFYKKKFDASNIDLARGLAKLILEEKSEVYPFAVLEPYIETILEQTMDPSKRTDFTKRVIRMAQPVTEENLIALRQFLKETEKDLHFRKARSRRLKKVTMCLKMKLESIQNYKLLWAGRHFNPKEWEDIFKGSRLDDQSFICTKKKHYKTKRRSLIQQQKSAFVSYGGDSPGPSTSSSSISLDKFSLKRPEREKTERPMSRSERAMTIKSREVSIWMKANVTKKNSYDEWRPGFSEKRASNRQKMLDIVINRVNEVAPNITDINDEMRRDFQYHKVQRQWMEKERQFRFITNLNMFSPILPPKDQDRKLMKFVQDPNYPYFGTFLSCQSYMERREPQKLVPTEAPERLKPVV